MPKIVEDLPTPNGESKVRLGVNLCDIDRMDVLMRQILLGGKIDLTEAIWVDKSRFDETCVVFTCDLLTAACICDTMRSHDRRVKDYPTRVYIQRAKAWVKVAGDELLSIVRDGKVILNPKLFPKSIEPLQASGPPLKKFF